MNDPVHVDPADAVAEGVAEVNIAALVGGETGRGGKQRVGGVPLVAGIAIVAVPGDGGNLAGGNRADAEAVEIGDDQRAVGREGQVDRKIERSIGDRAAV